MAVSRARDAAQFLYGAWNSRSRSKKVLTALALAMMIAGAGMLAYPAATHIYSSTKQRGLDAEFVSPQFERNFRAGRIIEGQVLTRIVIEKLGVNALIVEGTDPKALRAGAGHYRKTALPCQTGNVGIAGHRTTYGKPFSRLDELRAGDVLTLVTPGQSCDYVVVEGERGKRRPRRGAAAWITHPNDGAVLGPLSGSMLTLTTCHPKGSARERLILRARLQAA